MVDAVMFSIFLDMLHQLIELPLQAMPMFVVGVLRSGFVSLYDLSALLLFSHQSSAGRAQTAFRAYQLLGDIMVHCTSCGTDIVARAYNMHHCGQHNKPQLMIAAQVVRERLQNSSTCTIQLPTGGAVST